MQGVSILTDELLWMSEWHLKNYYFFMTNFSIWSGYVTSEKDSNERGQLFMTFNVTASDQIFSINLCNRWKKYLGRRLIDTNGNSNNTNWFEFSLRNFSNHTIIKKWETPEMNNESKYKPR